MSKEIHPAALEFGKAFVAVTRAHNRVPASMNQELDHSSSYISYVSTGKRVANLEFVQKYLESIGTLTDGELSALFDPYGCLLQEGLVPLERGQFSPDGRKRHAQNNSNREFTLALRAKMSEAASGEKNANFGKPLPEGTRRRISEALRGKRNPNYQRPLSAEQKQKISTKLRGRRQNPDSIRKMKETKRRNLEAKKALSSSTS